MPRQRVQRAVVGALIVVAAVAVGVYSIQAPPSQIGGWSWGVSFATAIFGVRFLWLVLGPRRSGPLVGPRLTSHLVGPPTLRVNTWFPFLLDDDEDDDVDGRDALPLNDREEAVLTALRQRAGGWPTGGVETWAQREDGGPALVALVSVRAVQEPPPPALREILWATFFQPDPSGRVRFPPLVQLFDIGILLTENELRGGPLHSQLHDLEEAAGSLAMPAVAWDAPDALDRVAAWFDACLRRPVQRCEWRHRGRIYAARYEFADTREGLVEGYAKRIAPPGQHRRLIDDGHFRGMGWVKTAAIGQPDAVRPVRVDGVPANAPALPQLGVWYQCPLEIR